MKKLIAAVVALAFAWAMEANAQVFGVAFGRPGISVAVAAPIAPVYYAPAPVYVAPAPAYVAPIAPAVAYAPSPYYYGGYYPYGYSASVTVAPFWGWGNCGWRGWGWGGCGWHGGSWGGWHGGWGGSWHGSSGWHGGGGSHGGHH